MPTLWQKIELNMFGNKKEFNLQKLRVGFSFDLFKKRWEITEIGQYDWRMDNTSIEYTIKTSNKTAYLEVELYKGKYEVIYSEEITIEESFLIDAINSSELIFNGKLYELDETYEGDYKNLTTYDSREDLECFIFYADDDEQITIERWQDGSYEAFIGEEIKSKKIKNIKEN